MNYFCNLRVEELRNLEALTGRTVSFGGMINNVQFRTSAKGKDWAMFSIEGYDESYDFRMFNEEFLKFRHFLLNNTFVYVKLQIREGWIRKDTGEKGEPRIQFMEVKLLHEVIPTYAKKIVVHMNVKELHPVQLTKMKEIFDRYRGDKPVSFEIAEIEKITEDEIFIPVIGKPQIDVDYDGEVMEEMDIELENVPAMETEKEEYRVINKLEMNSKNSRVNIVAEFLEELERLQVNFKLN
jgi:DNA polymerase-3 subunit alpha